MMTEKRRCILLFAFILLVGVCMSANGCKSDKGTMMTVHFTVGSDYFQTTDSKSVILYGVASMHINEDEVPGFNKEASNYLKNLISGKKVRVVQRAEKVINYSRVIVALVYLDGLLVNEEMLKRGYVYVAPRDMDNDPFLQRFNAAQEIAKTNKSGVWKYHD